jgi:hypothetical protein
MNPQIKTPSEIEAILRRPFRADQIGWKVQAVAKTGASALVVAYIDARDVMDRLDEAVGIAGWRDNFIHTPEGAVRCRLELKMDGEWIGKEDVGGQSDQPDEGDRHKAAVSDALKRAAVKWGIGRYLYSLPVTWVAYDAQKKQMAQTPKLPDWALPPKAPVPPMRTSSEVASETKQGSTTTQQTPPTVGTAPAAAPSQADKMRAHDDLLASKGLCRPGELLKHIVEAVVGLKQGYTADSTKWDAHAWDVARKATAEFEAQRTPATQELLDKLEREFDRTGETAERMLSRLSLPLDMPLNKLSVAQVRWAIEVMKHLENLAAAVRT